jgi:2-polyprenyl-3-methyl-5-hydroxy-6-metoxy-1,4-benzoquinol methylase
LDPTSANSRLTAPGQAFTGRDVCRRGLRLDPFPGPFDIVTSFDVIEHVPSLDDVAARSNPSFEPADI